MRNKNLLLVFGQLSLAFSIILSQFVTETNFVSCIIGFFIGLSIVFNLAFLISLKKKKEN
jgi:hypothetical protein